MKPNFVGAALVAICFGMPSQAQQSSGASPADSYGWLGTETVKTKFGEFEFKNGYPTPVAAEALLDQLKFNRAIEVYLTQIPPVSSSQNIAAWQTSERSDQISSSSGNN